MKRTRVSSRVTKSAAAEKNLSVAKGPSLLRVFFIITAVLVAVAALGIYAYSSTKSGIRKASIIMVAHNENQYLQRTFDSIMSNTPLDELLEVIFIDDESYPPASDVIDGMNNPLIRIIRNDERQGLIRAKSQGARESSGDVIIYLDAHIRAYPGWFEPLMRHTGENNKRIVVPLIPVLNETTWEQIGNYVGVKLLFDWKMDFIWLQDEKPIDDWVPIMSGGLLAISRDWFFESGAYDEGMLMWGGENVEQSVRNWLCGGEIVVARDSRVGHMFRDKSPYVINTTQIHVNKARAVDVWFDDWIEYYYRANPFDKQRRASSESLASRFAIKSQLACKPFSFFVDKFKPLFEKYKLLPAFTFHLQHVQTGLCVGIDANSTVVASLCNAADESQVWIPEEFERFRFGSHPNLCISSSGNELNGEQCSGHIADQLKWQHTDGTPVFKGGDQNCMHVDGVDKPVFMTTNNCTVRENFAQIHKNPYNHEKYSGYTHDTH